MPKHAKQRGPWQCPQLISIAVANITSKTNSRRKFYLVYTSRLDSSTEGIRARTACFPSLFSYTQKNHLPRSSTAHSELGHPTSISQENSPQTCPQVILIKAVTQPRLPRVTMGCVNLTTKRHSNTTHSRKLCLENRLTLWCVYHKRQIIIKEDVTVTLLVAGTERLILAPSSRRCCSLWSLWPQVTMSGVGQLATLYQQSGSRERTGSGSAL